MQEFSNIVFVRKVKLYKYSSFFLIQEHLPLTLKAYLLKLSTDMANFSSTIFILSLLLVATFTTACGPCSEPIKPKPSPKKAPPANPFCPRDTLKLGVCADVLGLVNVAIGSQVTSPCCSLLQGLADLEVAACLCTAIKANVLGIVKLDIPVALSALVSACAKTIPTGFKCN